MGRIWMPGGGGGADLDVITAGAADVLEGKVIVDQDGNPIGGTMPNRGAWESSGLIAGSSVVIPPGYHNGAGKVTAKDLTSQTPGDATAAQIWAGRKAWVNGQQVMGTLATQGGSTTIPGTAAKTIVTPNKIVTGNIAVAGDANLVAGNIKKNVTIFGVKGTCEGWFPTATDLYLRGQNLWFNTSKSSSSLKWESGVLTYPSDYSGGWYLVFKETFDLSPYNQLNIEFQYVGANFGSGSAIYLSTNQYSSTAVASVSAAQHYNVQTVSIPISSVYMSRVWYIVYALRQGGWNCYHIWLS